MLGCNPVCDSDSDSDSDSAGTSAALSSLQRAGEQGGRGWAPRGAALGEALCSHRLVGG